MHGVARKGVMNHAPTMERNDRAIDSSRKDINYEILV
jgi:hypothetical protein